MITIHVFNPEHDIALASHLDNFTAPHAGRQLRHDLGFLPALWASEGECVLVEDVDAAKESIRHLSIDSGAIFIDVEDLKALLGRRGDSLSKIKVLPWGWDAALRHDLIVDGIEPSNLPSNAWLNTIRLMSNRSWASSYLLKPLKEIEGTVGESTELKSVADVRNYLAKEHKIVLKAPWSSSGRGIRYLSDIENINEGNGSNTSTYYGLTAQLEGWINNVILRQGSIMAEPYYNKVCDFGMEFISSGDGIITYKGLSVFHTANGAYAGNLLDDESHKEANICKYLPDSLLRSVAMRIKNILSAAFANTYAGPFGVDMMVVNADGKLKLHPCVELNLRMTMGHVALLLANRFQLEDSIMKIVYTGGRYSLRLESI